MVKPVILEGRTIRLEPLTPEHAEALYERIDDTLFQHMRLWWFATSPEGMRENIVTALERPNTLSFALIDKQSGSPIGSSSYLDIRPEHRGLEIGATWISRPFQGTHVNPEMKYLMLRHAFESLNCMRVQLKTDSNNHQSQRAMEKLGCKKEGVLRKHTRGPGDYVRDTVMYSIIDSEWHEVKAQLEQRLGYAP